MPVVSGHPNSPASDHGSTRRTGRMRNLPHPVAEESACVSHSRRARDRPFRGACIVLVPNSCRCGENSVVTITRLAFQFNGPMTGVVRHIVCNSEQYKRGERRPATRTTMPDQGRRKEEAHVLATATIEVR